MFVDLREDPFHVAVVRFHDGRVQCRCHRAEFVVDFAEGSAADSVGLRFVAQKGGCEHAGAAVARFHAVIPVEVGRNADGRALEVDRHERERLAGPEFRDSPLDFRRLSVQVNANERTHDECYYIY